MGKRRWDGAVRRWGGYGLAFGLRRLLGTLDLRITHYDRSVDPSLPDFGGRGVYIFWHEYITLPIALWGNYDVAMLVSQHRDADWLTNAAEAFRFKVVRGSSTRGGSQAIRELKRLSETHCLTITPDGPLGPRRRMAMGPIYLASRLGIPIVPIGFGYASPWRLGTWDAFAIPRPYSRARAILGERMYVPGGLDRDGLEQRREEVEWALLRLTEEAERWAEDGDRREGELGFRRRRRRKAARQPVPGPPLSLAFHQPSGDFSTLESTPETRRRRLG